MTEKESLKFNQRLMSALHSEMPVMAGEFTLLLRMVHFTVDAMPMVFNWHTHKYFELGIPLDRPMIYRVGQTVFTGDFAEPFHVLIPAETRHTREITKPRSACLGLVLDIQSASGSGMRKLNDTISRRDFRIARTAESDRLLECIMTDLKSERRPFADAMLFLRLHEFLLELLRENFPGLFHDNAVVRNEGELLETIERYLSNNLCGENIKSGLTGLCGVSFRHLNRVFYRKYGISIKKFVIRGRLKTAAEMLINSDSSIKAVALECGFNNFSYFTRQFRVYYNSSPSEYRGYG